MRLEHSVRRELSLFCRANITVDELDYRDRLKVVLFVLLGGDVTSIERRRQMIAKFIDRAAAVPTELNILAIGESPVALGKIRSYRDGCSPHLRTQLEGLLLREATAGQIDVLSECPRSLPGG